MTAFIWTPLPPLRLREDGTGIVESLDHYALRLAHVCGTTRTRLAQMLRYGSNAYKKYQIGYVNASWTGPQSSYLSLLCPLVKLTGQTNLHRGTFVAVSNVLGRFGLSQNMGRAGRRRWCPRCYLEWDDDRSFEPLIWTFSMLWACPLHKVAMVENCPRCGALQYSNRSYDTRRHCVACKSSIGGVGRSAECSGIQSWTDTKLVNFVRFISSQDTPLPPKAYWEFFCAMRQRLRSGETFPPAIQQYVEEKSSVRNAGLPTIAQYLNMCAFQGCDIADILTCGLSAASKSLFDTKNGFGRVPFPARHVRSKFIRISKCMEQLLSDAPLRLPSLGLLCNQFKVWVDLVRDYFPDTHAMYSERFRKQAGEFANVHASRAFRCALHLFGINAEMAEQELVREVSARARVSSDLAAQCVSTTIVIRQFHDASLELPTSSDVDSFEQWMFGRDATLR